MTQNNEFSGCDNASNGRNTIFDWDDFFINRYWFNFFFNRNSRKYENIYLFGNYTVSAQIRGRRLIKKLGFYGGGLLQFLPKKPCQKSDGSFEF